MKKVFTKIKKAWQNATFRYWYIRFYGFPLWIAIYGFFFGKEKDPQNKES